MVTLNSISQDPTRRDSLSSFIPPPYTPSSSSTRHSSDQVIMLAQGPGGPPIPMPATTPDIPSSPDSGIHSREHTRMAHDNILNQIRQGTTGGLIFGGGNAGMGNRPPVNFQNIQQHQSGYYFVPASQIRFHPQADETVFAENVTINGIFYRGITLTQAGPDPSRTTILPLTTTMNRLRLTLHNDGYYTSSSPDYAGRAFYLQTDGTIASIVTGNNVRDRVTGAVIPQGTEQLLDTTNILPTFTNRPLLQSTKLFSQLGISPIQIRSNDWRNGGYASMNPNNPNTVYFLQQDGTVRIRNAATPQPQDQTIFYNNGVIQPLAAGTAELGSTRIIALLNLRPASGSTSTWQNGDGLIYEPQLNGTVFTQGGVNSSGVTISPRTFGFNRQGQFVFDTSEVGKTRLSSTMLIRHLGLVYHPQGKYWYNPASPNVKYDIQRDFSVFRRGEGGAAAATFKGIFTGNQPSWDTSTTGNTPLAANAPSTPKTHAARTDLITINATPLLLGPDATSSFDVWRFTTPDGRVPDYTAATDGGRLIRLEYTRNARNVYAYNSRNSRWDLIGTYDANFTFTPNGNDAYFNSDPGKIDVTTAIRNIDAARNHSTIGFRAARIAELDREIRGHQEFVDGCTVGGPLGWAFRLSDTVINAVAGGGPTLRDESEAELARLRPKRASFD